MRANIHGYARTFRAGLGTHLGNDGGSGVIETNVAAVNSDVFIGVSSHVQRRYTANLPVGMLCEFSANP
jgi:hypothetical protein